MWSNNYKSDIYLIWGGLINIDFGIASQAMLLVTTGFSKMIAVCEIKK